MKCRCGHTRHLHLVTPSHGGDVGPCRRKVCACEAWDHEPDLRPGRQVPVIDTVRPYTTVWTDGSSTGAWGPGGWGWAVIDGPLAGTEDHGGDVHTTNQRMELLAAHKAIRAISGLVLVVSDSQYVVRCFDEQWHVKWAEREYDKVKNADLWLPFVTDYLLRCGEVRFAWVKGHAGLAGNERADVLAKMGKVQNTVVPNGAK